MRFAPSLHAATPLWSLLLLALAGCSPRNTMAPLEATPPGEPFVLRSADDPRLKATGLLRPRTVSGTRRVRGPDPASYWNGVVTDRGHASPMPPPLFARAYALTHVAIHDALWAATRRGRLDEGAAGAGAASAVLSYLFPAAAGTMDSLAAAWVEPGDEEAFALGRAVGALVVEHARSDGSDTPFTGTVPAGEGIWSGTNPVLPMCGTWRCWILSAGDEVRPEPPYAYGSPADLADVEAVRQAALRRTPEQIAAVHEWADRSPPAIWNGYLLERVARRRMGAYASARAFAWLNVAMYDGFVSCWRAKYTYWTARPFQRIPDLVTVIPTPNFPSYTSGHSTISAAAAEVLAALLPAEADYFRAEAEEAALSRLWGGIHFPHDNDQGLLVGRRIGDRVVMAMRRGTAGSWVAEGLR